MPIGAIGAIAGIGSALIGASSANKAAKAQTAAANADIALQRETRDQIVERMQPFYQGGTAANAAMLSELGLGARPEGFTGFQASPGYQFAFDQGTAAVNALAGAKGGLNSGRTMQDLTTFGQGIANQEYGNWWNRLSGLAGSGQNAAASQGTAMSGAAANISGALGAIGNAQAAGSIGVANAINGGIQNYLGYQQYQNGLNSGLRNGIGTPGTTVGLFGGGR